MKTTLIFLLVINFSSLTLGQESDKVTTDTTTENPTKSLEKGVDGLVKIVHGFLNAVQDEDFITVEKGEGKINFGEVQKIIKDGNYGEFAGRWRDLVSVFGGFAACVVIGLIFLLCMPVAACINCCCFCCCKKCGKASSRTDPKTAKCQRCTFGSILFLLAVLLLVGAIFAVISNEILHSKLDNVNDQGPVGQIKTSLDGLISFASSTGSDIVTKSIKTVEETVSALIDIIRDASSKTVTDIQDTINATSLLDQLDSIGTNAKISAESLRNVQKEVTLLKELQINTTAQLKDVKDNLEEICQGAGPCPDINGLSLALDFSGLSDLSSISTAVDNVTGIATEAGKARDQFDKVKNDIQDQLNGTINDAATQSEKVKQDILKEIPTIDSTIHNMTKNLNVTNSLNDMDDALKEYGDYIWYVFIGVPCLMILVVVFYFLGLLFGTCGERPGPGAPCCNKGAGSNMLCCGVICSYLFASILMLVVIIMFIPFGLLYTNGCRYLNDGVENLEKFEFVVNDTLGFNIQSYIDPDNKSNGTETIGLILRNCKEDQGIYTAFHLENLFDIDKVLDMSKITSEINKIVAEGSKASIKNIDIIPADLKDKLDNFSASGITTINFTQYDDVLEAPLAPDLSSLIKALETSQNNTQNATVADRLGQERQKLIEIQGDELAQIEYARVNLSQALSSLRNQTSLGDQIQNLIASLNKSQVKFNTESSDILNKSLVRIQADLLDKVNEEIGDIKTFIRGVGPCKPIYDSVQTLSDALCVTFLDRVNSIWFGLGWGLAFYIPCIIFALCTASLYQREMPYDSFHQTRSVKKKKNKEESQFDNPDIDAYQGHGQNHGYGYDAYGGGAQGDNIPLTGMGRGGDHNRGRGDGVANEGYYSPERRNGGRSDYRRSGHHDAMDGGYRGGGGYPDHRRGSGGYSSPPPYNGHEDYPLHSSSNKYRQY